jgi:hypothetical protein
MTVSYTDTYQFKKPCHWLCVSYLPPDGRFRTSQEPVKKRLALGIKRQALGVRR